MGYRHGELEKKEEWGTLLMFQGLGMLDRHGTAVLSAPLRGVDKITLYLPTSGPSPEFSSE